jgi:hypothetical protein
MALRAVRLRGARGARVCAGGPRLQPGTRVAGSGAPLPPIFGAPIGLGSINCAKGRHRSVAAAEILRRYYPKAVVRHLAIS